VFFFKKKPNKKQPKNPQTKQKNNGKTVLGTKLQKGVV